MRVLIDTPLDPFAFRYFSFNPLLVIHTKLLTLALCIHLWHLLLYPDLFFLTLVAVSVYNVLKFLQTRQCSLGPWIPVAFKTVFDIFCLPLWLLRMNHFVRPKEDIVLRFEDKNTSTEERLGTVVWVFVPEPVKRLIILLLWLREWLGKLCHWPRWTPKLIPILPVPKPKEPWEWRELKKQTTVTLLELQKRTAVSKLPKQSAGMLPDRPNRFQAPEWYPKIGRERRVSCSIDVACSLRRNMWMTGAILGKDEDQTQQDNESDDSTLNRKRRKSNTRRISFKSKEIELITRPRQEKPWEKPGWIEPTFAPEVEMQDAPPLVPTPEVEKQENAVPEAEQQENTAPSSPTQRPTELPTDRKFRRLACNRPLERSGLVYDSKAKKVRPCTEQEEIETLYCIGHPEHPVPKPKEEKRWVKIGDMHTKESLKSIPTLEPTRKRWFPWFKPVITEPKESKPKPEIIRTIAERNHDDTLIPGWEADLPKLMYM